MRLHLAAGFLALTALLSGCGGDRQVQGSPVGSASTTAEPTVDAEADAKAVQSVFDTNTAPRPVRRTVRRSRR